MICGDCSYFICYREFNGEPTASIVTMGCGLLGNEKDYNRIEGDKIASTTFKECPLRRGGM